MIATTTLMIAGLVIAAGTAAYSGYMAADAADEQKKLLEQDAQNQLTAGDAEAEKIRDRARRIKASQVSALAESGVKLDDSGTPSTILQETDRLAESDAMAALRDAKNRAFFSNKQAGMYGDLATAKAIGTGLTVAGTAIGGYNSMLQAEASGKLATQMNLDTKSLNFAQANGSKYSLLAGTGL